MARTTPALVASVVEVDPAIDLNPIIDVANSIVTEQCAVTIPPLEGGDEDDESGAVSPTDARLEMIERYVAAHLYAIRDPSARTTAEKAGDVWQTYGGKFDGMGLESTMYGQTAITLDVTGNLYRLSKQLPKHQVLFVGGRPPGSRRGIHVDFDD